MNAKYL